VIRGGCAAVVAGGAGCWAVMRTRSRIASQTSRDDKGATGDPERLDRCRRRRCWMLGRDAYEEPVSRPRHPATTTVQPHRRHAPTREPRRRRATTRARDRDDDVRSDRRTAAPDPNRGVRAERPSLQNAVFRRIPALGRVESPRRMHGSPSFEARGSPAMRCTLRVHAPGDHQHAVRTKYCPPSFSGMSLAIIGACLAFVGVRRVT